MKITLRNTITGEIKERQVETNFFQKDNWENRVETMKENWAIELAKKEIEEDSTRKIDMGIEGDKEEVLKLAKIHLKKIQLEKKEDA